VRAAVVAVVGLSGCTCGLDPLLEVDGGTDAGAVTEDAGSQIDAGIDGDAGVDAGVDAGEPCFFPPVEPISYSPDGSEDFVDPEGDTLFPDVDLLATWSRIEGDEVIVELLFAAPPWRSTFRAGGLRVGFFVDDDEAGIEICGQVDPESNCTLPDVLVGTGIYAESGWPPTDIALSVCPQASNGTQCSLSTIEAACDYVFTTENEPFLQLRLPRLRLGLDTSTSYVVDMSYAPCRGTNLCEVTWQSPSESIAIGGTTAPAAEPFVSVCDVLCAEE
jgi:hypothetical protein